MKKVSYILVFTCTFFLLMGCSEGINDFKDSFHSESEMVIYLEDNSKAIDKFNEFIDSFDRNIANISDMEELLDALKTETEPLLKEAVSLSKVGEYSTKSYLDLKKQRVNAFLKAQEAYNQLVFVYNKDEFTVEDENEAFALFDEAYKMMDDYNENFVLFGKDTNEEIVLE